MITISKNIRLTALIAVAALANISVFAMHLPTPTLTCVTTQDGLKQVLSLGPVSEAKWTEGDYEKRQKIYTCKPEITYPAGVKDVTIQITETDVCPLADSGSRFRLDSNTKTFQLQRQFSTQPMIVEAIITRPTGTYTEQLRIQDVQPTQTFASWAISLLQ